MCATPDRYLRDVVRLDPTRALTQRLREQLSSGAGQRYALALAGATPMQLLQVHKERERPWVSVDAQLEIEDGHLAPKTRDE